MSKRFTSTNKHMHHRAKKSLGQHFLKSKKALSDMIAAGNVTSTDTVLEIGPGKGALTKELLQHAGKVIAIEKDKSLIPVLEETFAEEIKNKKLVLIEGDMMEDNIQLPREYKVIANIPYYITGALFQMFLEREAQPSAVVFLVQKEVAERIVGRHPTASRRLRGAQESILSLSVKAYGEPKYVSKVPKHYFSPEPKVDSAIIAITNISKQKFETAHITEKAFFNVVKIGFAHKRKVLVQNLVELLTPPSAKGLPPPLDRGGKTPKEIIQKAFENLSLSLKIRAENVELPLWIALTQALAPHIHTK